MTKPLIITKQQFMAKQQIYLRFENKVSDIIPDVSNNELSNSLPKCYHYFVKTPLNYH